MSHLDPARQVRSHPPLAQAIVHVAPGSHVNWHLPAPQPTVHTAPAPQTPVQPPDPHENVQLACGGHWSEQALDPQVRSQEGGQTHASSVHGAVASTSTSDASRGPRPSEPAPESGPPALASTPSTRTSSPSPMTDAQPVAGASRAATRNEGLTPRMLRHDVARGHGWVARRLERRTSDPRRGWSAGTTSALAPRRTTRARSRGRCASRTPTSA
jgi:hypothetical protein